METKSFDFMGLIMSLVTKMMKELMKMKNMEAKCFDFLSFMMNLVMKIYDIRIDIF
jgi:hypothetical protein